MNVIKMFWAVAMFIVLMLMGLGLQPLGAQENGDGVNGRVQIVERVVQPNGAIHTTAVLEPDQDSYVASLQNTTRFGGSDELRVGYDTENGAQQILLRFNLTDDLPDEANNILTATLTLYVQDHSPSIDPPMVIEARQITSEWEESIVTWSNRPTIGDNLQDETGVNRDDGFYEWDITSLVGDWEAGRLSNNGVALLGDESPSAARLRVMASKEAQLVFRPRLYVEYQEFNDTQPPVITVNALPAYSPDVFLVQWSGNDAGDSGIAYYDVQYRRDGGDWVDWQTETTETAAAFTIGEVGSRYDFRARGVDNAGNVEAFGDVEATTVFGVDAPEAVMVALSPITLSRTFTVNWTNTNDVPASNYQLYYRAQAISPDWRLFIETDMTSALFIAGSDAIYEFEVIAIGTEGFDEPLRNVAETVTAVDTEAPFILPTLYLPLTFRP